jgi:hypothetical protein
VKANRESGVELELVSPRPVRSTLDVVIPYTDSGLAMEAGRLSRQFAASLGINVRLVRIQEVPYPMPLAKPPVAVAHLKAEGLRLAQAMPSAEVQIVLTRDARQSLLRLLHKDSIVILISPRRWWRTKEEKLNHFLTVRGYRVLLSYV